MVLGTNIQNSNSADFTCQKVGKTTSKKARIVKRITKVKHGMREEDTLRLFQALMMSRNAYSLPYYVLSYSQTKEAKAIIRTAYKAALALPIYTANQKLYDLGVCNTFEEIRDATLASQQESKPDNAEPFLLE